MTLIEQIAYYSPWWHEMDWYLRDKHLQEVTDSGIADKSFIDQSYKSNLEQFPEIQLCEK